MNSVSRLCSLLLATLLAFVPSFVLADQRAAFDSLAELDQVALILAGVSEGQHRVGGQDMVMVRSGEGVFEIRPAGWEAGMGYREITITEAGPCKYLIVSRLMENGSAFSRQNSIADLGDIVDLTYSPAADAPHVLRFTGSNLSLANFFGELQVYATQSPEAMNAAAKHFLDTIC